LSRFVLDNTVTMAWCFDDETTPFTEALLSRLSSLADLPIEIEDPTRTSMFVSVRALAGKYKLTAYDASYLELAIRHDLPVATLDKALMKVAREAGVNLVQL
jgi:predicted nucleic acid-binding protein